MESPSTGGLSYIESLKGRIQALRGRVQEVNEEATTSVNFPNTVQLGQNGFQRSGSATSTSEIGVESQNNLHDTMQEASYLSLAAMAADRQPFPTEGLSFLTLLHAAIDVSGANPATSSESNAIRSGPLAEFRKSMFPTDGSHPMTVDDAFLAHCIETTPYSIPCMAGMELKAIFDTETERRDSDVVAELANASPVTAFMKYIVLAIGLSQSTGYVFKEPLATEYAASAMELIPRVFDNADEFTIVKCLTALTIYSMYTTFGGSTWHLLGFTMTRCVASGMHTSRVTDAGPDDKNKQGCPIFWSLYTLDTQISTSLDRPFCLSDGDIMVDLPHWTELNGRGKLPHLIEHAQLLRAIRHQPESDVWIHYINLRHWYETIHSQAPPSRHNLQTLQQSQLLIRGFIELIKQPSSRSSEHWAMILHGAAPDIVDYFTLFEKHLLKQGGAPSAFDALDVFGASVIIMQLPMRNALGMGEHTQDIIAARQRSIAQAINILTMLSVRYTPARSLRNVLSEYRTVSVGEQLAGSSDRLRDLIGQTEISISHHMQDVILSSLEQL
jgi:hypothetical protein